MKIEREKQRRPAKTRLKDLLVNTWKTTVRNNYSET
jgi:hypothetical protein